MMARTGGFIASSIMLVVLSIDRFTLLLYMYVVKLISRTCTGLSCNFFTFQRILFIFVFEVSYLSGVSSKEVTGMGLLQAYFRNSEVLNGFYGVPRSGANYI